MIDPILKARLDIIEQHLRSAENNCLFVESVCSLLCSLKELDSKKLRFSALSAGNREALRKAISRQITVHKNSIRDISKKLSEAEGIGDADAKKRLLAEAWCSYVVVHGQSQNFFSEYLEVIGGLTFGLAFRSSQADNIYELADDLIRFCVTSSTSQFRESVYPALPVSPETLLKTLAHIIGLRFPDWTIWTLPMTSHELGHVIIHEDENLKELKNWIDKHESEKTRKYLAELVADAFATYLMGPAYVCSVVLLKLDPINSYQDHDDHPADAKRAEVIFSILEWMDNQVDTNPCRNTIKQLRDYWQGMILRAGELSELEFSDGEQIKELVERATKEFENNLPFIAKYPMSGGNNGLLMAMTWSEAWHHQLETPPITIEEVSGNSQIRDVFNAAWLCRLKIASDKEKLEQIEAASYKLWEAIRSARDLAAKSSQRRLPGR